MNWNGHVYRSSKRLGLEPQSQYWCIMIVVPFSSFNSNFLPLFQFFIILPWLELPPISSSAGLVPGNGS